MYFSNISDTELNQYHNKTKNNVTIKLTNALSSPLFKIETIISDKLYKIYPLFYCNEITSTNPNDRTLDNKCIICVKNNNTILSFTTPFDFKNTISLGYSYSATWFGFIIYTYDKNTGKSLEGVEVDCTVDVSGVDVNVNGVTNSKGVFFYMASSGYFYGYSKFLLNFEGVTYDLMEEE